MKSNNINNTRITNLVASVSFILLSPNRVVTCLSLFFVLLLTIGCGNVTTNNTTPEPQKITISFDTQDGSAVPEQTITKDTKLTTNPNAPTKTNYQFNGWFKTPTGGTQINLDTETFTITTTIYAQWTQTAFTVIFNLNGDNTTEKPEDQTVQRNNRATKPTTEPKRTGYNFVEWYLSATTNNNAQPFDFNTIIIQDITLYAIWTQDFVITYDSQGGSPVPPKILTGTTTTASPPENPTRENYTFVNWYTEPTNGDVVSFSLSVTENKTLYARWKRIQIIVSFDTQGGNNISEQTINKGDALTNVPDNPIKANYVFKGWFTEQTGGNKVNLQTKIFDASITIYAQWYIIQRIVSFDTQGGSTVSDQTINNGGKLTTKPSDPTKVNFMFNGWYTTRIGGEQVNLLIKTFDASTTLYAQWTRIKIIISFDTQGGGTVSEQTLFQAGKLSNIPLNPTKPMYKFKGWFATQTGGDKINLETQTFNASTTIYTQWILIIVSFDTQGGSTVSEQTITQTGTISTIPLDPTKTHFKFNGWFNAQTDGEKINLESNIFDESTTLYAQWRHKPETKEALIAEINRAIQTKGNNVNLNYIDTSLITDMSELFKNKISFNGNISDWNVSAVQNMDQMFSGATIFAGNIGDWNVSAVENMNQMFYATSNFNGNISNWNVTSNIVMTSMFNSATAFNQDLNNWNVSAVRYMNHLFNGATNFNGNISDWNVSSIIDMTGMFNDATKFNGNISGWNVSAVKNMNQMFKSASKFNGNISGWNVSAVQDMKQLFRGATLFNQDLNNWNVSAVIYMNQMFNGATVFNQDLNNWNVSDVIYMNQMFNGAIVFNQDLNNWNVSAVQNMSNMFDSTTKFNGNISNWNVETVQDMNQMFRGATSFNQDLNNWNVSTVKNMSNMFHGATIFNGNINNWNVEGVQNINYIFDSAIAFNQDLNNWNVEDFLNMEGMFSGAIKFNGNISNWNVSAVQYMSHMFRGATAFNGNIGDWNVSAVQFMNQMFNGATAFNKDLNNWNVSAVQNMTRMFADATSFNGNISNWNVSSVRVISQMFKGATNFNGNINSWNVSDTVIKTETFVDSGLENSPPAWAR